MPRTPAIAWLLSLLILTLAAPSEGNEPKASAAPTRVEIQAALTRGLGLVRKAAENYPTHRDCFSCHHQTLPMQAVVKAGKIRGGPDRPLIQAQADFTLESFAEKTPAMAEGRGVGGGAMTVSYALWALDLAGRKPDATTDAMVAFLLKTRRKDGTWTTGHRPPLEESSVTVTALSAVGIDRFASPARREAADRAVARALVWLEKTPFAFHVQEDRNFRLWGLVRLHGREESVSGAIRDVLSTQQEEGGWSSAEGLPADAYATGQALAVLREAGVAADTPAYRRGVRFLLDTQRGDGSWKVETRSKPIQVYFDNGDPHGTHQFISTPATCWAVVALAGALDKDRGKSRDD